MKRKDQKDQSNLVLPYLGTIDQCIEVIENETDVKRFHKIIGIIDSNFGVTSDPTTNELMDAAMKVGNRDLIVLSGYAHLLLAEQMYKKGFDKKSINKQLSKAEALLYYANMGGNHPLLPRAMRLKRRVNWKSYTKLVLSCIALLGIILLIGYLYRYISNLDFDFF